MFLGIDIGTSAVKALLVDEDDGIVGEASAELSISRPRPLWSEQDPESWWRATCEAVGALGSAHGAALRAVRGMGLSGQMHGATLLDDADGVLRPAILWNDGRCAAQCAELAEAVPELEQLAGNRAMPGFTAPKLLWVRAHEPDVFRRVRRVLLPKDFVRLRLCGEYATDASDAAGTLWLDVGARAWSLPLLAATGLDEQAMPKLFEGTAPTGVVRAAVARQMGLRDDVVIAAGGGDNAAGAVGMGVLGPGQAMLSLGTSGVYFAAASDYRPYTAGGVHTFCHALPGRWHHMGVLLSAASCLAWHARVHRTDVADLLAELAPTSAPSPVTFLPYLSGERTPHDDPSAMGVFFGLTHDVTRADLTRAVLEGVAFAFADAQSSLRAAGAVLDDVTVIGGGARSGLWGRILASALGRPLSFREGAERGAAFGAARLARLAVTGETPEDVCRPGRIRDVVEPDAELARGYVERIAVFRELYEKLAPTFAGQR